MEQHPSKISTSIAIASDLRNRLDAEAAKQERSRSFLTAQAIKEYLAKREPAGNDR
jgi:predicted transcriptional regulator